MNETEKIVSAQHAFFKQGQTLDVEFRRKALTALRESLRKHGAELYSALRADLGKGETESIMTETGMVFEEIEYLLKNLNRLARAKRVKTAFAQMPAKCYTLPSPYGVALIMSPWNYPLQLTLCPLADCIAAGNCAVVKPSAYAPATAEVLEKILGQIYPREYVAVVTGGREQNGALLAQKYDMIFFTGGKATGKIVAQAAASSLTPVVLELGGKSPCIVDSDADLPLAAKRVAFGKLLNAGQTCVAPDYLLVQNSVKDRFLEELKTELVRQGAENALKNAEYPHIVNEKHYVRAKSLIDPKKVVFGGNFDDASLKIQPTVLDGVTLEDAVMQEEIFAPVLPVLTFEDFEDAKRTIDRNPFPLALYYFGKKNEMRALREIRFGGGCVNDTVVHLATPYMGFGGVGESGMGAYHGECGFNAFSHVKSIQKKGKSELTVRYLPYTQKKKKFIRKYLG